MQDLISNKKILRKNALSERLFLEKIGKNDILSSLVVKNIEVSSDFINSKNIALYYPIKAEINLLKLLENKDKNFFFPKCINDELYFSPISSIADFKIGKYGINEPISSPISSSIIDVIYIPALIANSRCFRLGYGAGYYDRFFRNNKLKCKKNIVIASKFVTDEFIEDSFDVQCDTIISEII